MAIPWKVLDRFTAPGGDTLELRQRGEGDFIIFHNGQVLMNSKAQRSEIALGSLGCEGLGRHPAPRVLVGGLGMGFTLRAVLDALGEGARMTVVELNPVIVAWCQGPLAGLTDRAVADGRVTVVTGDVAEHIRRCGREKPAGRLDAIILDLYCGPRSPADGRNDPIYGLRAIQHTRAALKHGGIFAVWGENRDTVFAERLRRGGFAVTCRRPGRGAYRHMVFLARKTDRGTQPAGDAVDVFPAPRN